MKRLPLPPGQSYVTSFGELKQRQAVVAERRAKGAASSLYNRMYNLNVRRNDWQVSLNTVSLRRQGAERNVADIEARLSAMEQRAVDDPRVLALIRPARDSLEVAREILARTIDAEKVELERFKAKMAEAAAQEAAWNAEAAE